MLFSAYCDRGVLDKKMPDAYVVCTRELGLEFEWAISDCYGHFEIHIFFWLRY